MMREQHIKSMAGYYSSLYENIDLSGCEALKAFTVEENDEEYNYIDEYEEYEEDGEYTGSVGCVRIFGAIRGSDEVKYH